MDKRLQLAYNLRFNPHNQRHIAAAEMLSTIAQGYKSTFVTLAIEAYLAAHPNGIDMAELLEVGKTIRHSYQPKASIVDNLNKKAAREESQISDRVIDNAMDFYHID